MRFRLFIGNISPPWCLPKWKNCKLRQQISGAIASFQFYVFFGLWMGPFKQCLSLLVEFEVILKIPTKTENNSTKFSMKCHYFHREINQMSLMNYIIIISFCFPLVRRSIKFICILWTLWNAKTPKYFL